MFFFCKQKTAYEMRISDWSSDVCSSDLYRWRRQVPIGHYIADFASHRCRLVIELDGEQHAFAAEQDAQRTRFIESEGYRVMRFWNEIGRASCRERVCQYV